MVKCFLEPSDHPWHCESKYCKQLNIRVLACGHHSVSPCSQGYAQESITLRAQRSMPCSVVSECWRAFIEQNNTAIEPAVQIIRLVFVLFYIFFCSNVHYYHSMTRMSMQCRSISSSARMLLYPFDTGSWSFLLLPILK